MAAAGLRRAELIAALSLATDLGTGLGLKHGLRACLIATGLAGRLGLSVTEQADAYNAALLTYVGCTSESHHVADLLGTSRPSAPWPARTPRARRPAWPGCC